MDKMKIFLRNLKIALKFRKKRWFDWKLYFQKRQCRSCGHFSCQHDPPILGSVNNKFICMECDCKNYAGKVSQK